jgi:signal transduction histidine kinase
MASQFGRAPIAFAVTEGPAHTMRYANAEFRQLLADDEIAVGRTSPTVERQPIDVSPLLDRAFRGEAVHDELLAPPTGTARWSFTAWLIEAETGAENGLVIEVRDAAEVDRIMTRQRALTERLLLGALREQDTARQAIEAGRSATFLATASHDLARSLDQDATRALVQHSVLPRKGTWCIVDMIESNGQTHRLAVAHPDPAKQTVAQALADAWYPTPKDPVDPLSVARLATGNPIVFTKDSGAALIAAAHGPQNLAVLRELGFGALLVVPLVVRGAVLGTITFVSAEGDDPFTADEIALASNLADRCALALDNARLYRETDALRAVANDANRAKSEFLRNVGHELRTPLYAIGGYVDLLATTMRGTLTPEQHSDLARIKYNQQHLVTVISQLINFVRAESGRVEYRFEEVPVRAALADVAELLDGAARERQLTLVLRPEPSDTSVFADPDRLRQILLNLVMNGIKYSPIGGGNITLGFTQMSDTVLIQVSDLGLGIPAEKLEAIFEQFVQLPSGAATRHAGFGLGLGISRDLARAMGGDLTVESTLGVGSRFTLTLPRPRRS